MESYIFQYKNISIKIIEFLKDDKIQEAEELINERENILEYINKLYKSGATINENDKNELKQIDVEIYNIIYHKKKEVKFSIEILRKEKQANLIYRKKFENIFFMNKKV